jgi:hypothetical protein
VICLPVTNCRIGTMTAIAAVEVRALDVAVVPQKSSPSRMAPMNVCEHGG